MKIAVLAGDKTEHITGLLKAKSNFSIYYNEDLETGLSDIMLSSDISKVVLFDTTFIRGGRELNYVEVFNALRQVSSAKENLEIILLSKSSKLFDASLKAMASSYNFRAVLLEAMNSQKIIDAILNRTKTEVEVPKEDSVVDNVSIGLTDSQSNVNIASEDKPVLRGEVVGTYIEPTPTPRAVEPEPKKKSKFSLPLKNRKNLMDILTSKKIVVVTGNNNSGVTNLCSELGYVTAISGAKTVMVDLDTHYHGLNMYYDDLDKGTCEPSTRTGLLSGLRDLDTLDDCTHQIYDNLYLLGTRSDIEHIKFKEFLSNDDYLSDVVHTLVVDYDVIYLHIPIEDLTRYPDIIKVCTEIVYASNSTINGVYAIGRYLRSDDATISRLMTIVHRKLKIVLTNYTNPKTVASSNFCEVLLNIAETIKTVKDVCGVVNNQKDFDEFSDTKKLYSRDGKELNNFLDIAYNILN